MQQCILGWRQQHRKGRWYNNDCDSDSYNSITTLGGGGGEGYREEMNTIKIKKWIIKRRRKRRQQNNDDMKVEDSGNGDGEKL